MSVDFAAMVALAVLSLFFITGLQAFPPRTRLLFDGFCFALSSAILLTLSRGAPGAAIVDQVNSDPFWLKAVLIAWWLTGARLLSVGFARLLHPGAGTRQARLGSDLVSASIYALTLGFVLRFVFGVSVGGVLATSGVLAIVLGLALQSTLADVFAGLAVGLDAPFHLGDRVRIGDLAEGVVAEMNWRAIRIHTDTDDVATVPNSVVAKAMIYNFSFPIRRRGVTVEINAPSAFDPDRVIAVLLEGAALCVDILAEPKPVAVVSHLGSARNIYSVTFFAADSARSGPSRDSFLRYARRQLHFAGLLTPPGGGDAPTSADLRRQVLREIALFEPLALDHLATLAENAKPLTLAPGERLFAQGAADTLLYVFTTGVIEITRETDGVAETMGRLGAGAYVGEASLINGSPHAATATALTPVGGFVISRDSLAPMLAENEALAAAFEQSAQLGLKRLDRKVAASAAASEDFTGRLIAYFRAIAHVRAASEGRRERADV